MAISKQTCRSGNQYPVIQKAHENCVVYGYRLPSGNWVYVHARELNRNEIR